MPAGLTDLSLAEFARAVASREPIPGSGSVAAAVGALGAGLASMALAPARGEGAPEAARELSALMEALLAAVQSDAEAYRAFLAARAEGRGLDEAVERAIAVPAEVAGSSLAALERLAAASSRVRAALRCEAATAGQALLAAVEGATFTARSNLTGLSDPAARAQRAAELQALLARARTSAARLHALLESLR